MLFSTLKMFAVRSGRDRSQACVLGSTGAGGMRRKGLILAALALPAMAAAAEGSGPDRIWNWHVQNTDIVQGDFSFPAKYSGPNSLNSGSEVQETVTMDLFAGVRLWRGAEAHMDFLMWQGFGLSKTFGLEGFPNGDAYKAGTATPYFNFARLFIRQTIGWGGEQEDIPDDQLTLGGKVCPESRVCVKLLDRSLADGKTPRRVAALKPL
jgi:hypothetical protein